VDAGQAEIAEEADRPVKVGTDRRIDARPLTLQTGFSARGDTAQIRASGFGSTNEEDMARLRVYDVIVKLFHF